MSTPADTPRRVHDPFLRFAVFAFLAGIAIGLPMAAVAWKHLGSPNLWFDESGQYWLSMGLHHFSDPHSAFGGWSKMVEYGRVFNSDPGLFTVLLRLWTALWHASPLALRSLPFLFFLLTPVVILLSLLRSKVHPALAIAAAAIPAGFPMLLQYSTEIRAYSMEACAVSFLFFLPCWLQGETKNKTIFLLGCIGALAVLSRYSAFLFGAAACLTTLFSYKPARNAVIRTLIFSLPMTAAVAAGYLIFARYQAGGSLKPPAYVDDFILQGKDTGKSLILVRENFLSPEAIPLSFYLVVAPFFALFGPRSLSGLRIVIGRTVLFCLLSVALLALASLAGKLPWSLHTRWSIGYQALSACCLAMTLVAAGEFLRTKATTVAWKSATVILATGFAVAWAAQINRSLRGERLYYETIASHLETLAQSPGPGKLRFFIPAGASPTVRYLCEYGPLTGVYGYPENFHFETSDESTKAGPISAKTYDVIVLTHFSMADSYRNRVVDGSAELHGTPQPSCLILLKK